MNSKRRCKRRGFTLIETLMAVFLIVLAISAFVVGQSSSIRMSMRSKEIYRATLLAQQKLAEVERKVLKEGFGAYSEKESGEFDQTRFPGYSWEIQIKKSGLDLLLGAASPSETKDTANQLGATGSQADIMKLASDFIEQSVKLVECNVSWGIGKRKKTVTLQTYMAKLDGGITGLNQLLQSGQSETPSQGGQP